MRDKARCTVGRIVARNRSAGNMRDKVRCTVGRIVARNRSAGNMRDKVRCTVGRIVGRDRSVGEYEGEGSLTVRWMSCGKGPIMREGGAWNMYEKAIKNQSVIL